MARKIPTILALLALLASPALAHKVNVFAVAENGFITGEGYFSGGAKAQNATVELLNAKGELLAQAMTGADGAFRLPLPPGAGAPLTVVLKAGDGHQNDFTLTAKDLGQNPGQTGSLPPPTPGALAIPGVTRAAGVPAQAPDAASASVPGQAPAKASTQTPESAGSASASVAAPLDEARLSALVEAAAARAVEEKLTPLKLELARMAAQEQSTRMRDIIGGIGWIIGLVGVAAWFKRPKH